MSQLNAEEFMEEPEEFDIQYFCNDHVEAAPDGRVLLETVK